uniref:Uncharacterized protein n=1 Tax=Leersia perrieri TaxID=77586 RepID=A0A0D9WER7_9ORYZ
MQRGLTHADEQISTSPKHIRLQVQTPRLLLPRLWLAATHPICFARRQERSGGWRRAAARPEFSLNSRDSAIYPTAVQEAGAQDQSRKQSKLATASFSIEVQAFSNDLFPNYHVNFYVASPGCITEAKGELRTGSEELFSTSACSSRSRALLGARLAR